MDMIYSTVFAVVYRGEENCHPFYAGELLVIPSYLGKKAEQSPSDPEDPSLDQVPQSLTSYQNLLRRKDMVR